MSKTKKMTAARLIAAYGELLKTEPLTTAVVRVDDDGETEVGADEVLRHPARYRLVTTRGEEAEVLAESEPVMKTGTELTKDQAIAREIQRSGDMYALHLQQGHQERDWYHRRFLEDQKKIEAQREELATKDAQIAELCVKVESSGDELVELLKEGILVFKDYSFTSELKKRLNRAAPGLQPAHMNLIAEIINSDEFQGRTVDESKKEN